MAITRPVHRIYLNLVNIISKATDQNVNIFFLGQNVKINVQINKLIMKVTKAMVTAHRFIRTQLKILRKN